MLRLKDWAMRRIHAKEQMYSIYIPTYMLHWFKINCYLNQICDLYISNYSIMFLELQDIFQFKSMEFILLLMEAKTYWGR